MKNKTKYFITFGLVILSTILLIASTIITEHNKDLWWTILVSSIIFVGLIVICFYYYIKVVEFVCPKCNAQFKPKASETVWAMHTVTKRYLKCPKCGKYHWCKRKFIED